MNQKLSSGSGAGSGSSFWNYVQKAHVTENPRGDFISDARRDRSLRDKEITTLRELKGHVMCAGGCFEAVATASAVWRTYRQWLKARGQA